MLDVLFTFAAISLAPLSQTPQRLTYEDVANRTGNWTSGAPATRWAWDGKHVEVAGEPAKWVDPRTGDESEAQKKPKDDAAPGKPATARASIRDGSSR
ncbi:MAG: hypothetical protein IPJ77_18220 [Planctomycetes bacterium]|nr:hypothetical protein [Planctomycetota bacterium]